MLGLPKSITLSKQLSKNAIYRKFNMNPEAQKKFDAEISRITIVAEISPARINIAAGKEISSIFVLLVSLKQKKYNEATVSQLFKLIDQNIVLLLEYEDEQRLAIYHTKLIQSDWKPAEEWTLALKGLNLDDVWDNIVTQIGSIDIEKGNSLEEQIAVDEQRAKILKEIARLEAQARKEKQPKKKFELVQRINNLRKELEVGA